MGDVISLNQAKERKAADVIDFIGDGIRAQIEREVGHAVDFELTQPLHTCFDWEMCWTDGRASVSRYLQGSLDMALDSMEALEPFTRRVVQEFTQQLEGVN